MRNLDRPVPADGGPSEDGHSPNALAALQPDLAGGLVRGGALTLALPDQPPFIIQPSPTPAGHAVVLFDSRHATERFLRDHPALWAISDRFELHEWAPDRVGYIIDVASRHGLDVLVRTPTEAPELLDPTVALAALAAAGITLMPVEQRPTPVPPPSATIDVTRGATGPVFALRF